MIKESQITTYFERNDGLIRQNTEEIINEFSEYFVNVGPNLAKETDLLTEEGNYLDLATNSDSVFLGETDVLEVVRRFKNKRSTDSNSTDMSTTKEVVDYVLKPFTDICRYFS